MRLSSFSIMIKVYEKETFVFHSKRGWRRRANDNQYCKIIASGAVGHYFLQGEYTMHGAEWTNR